MRIYLVGYMASGKSNAAEELSSVLGYMAIDIDRKIEEKEGRSIENIFSENGEDYFRKVEQSTLFETLDIDNIVVATGGGLPCYYGNMEWMNQNGITIYLEANAGLLFHRLVKNREKRPLLKGLTDIELMERISSHLVSRIPFYQKSKITFPAINFSAKKLVSRLSTLKT